MDRQGTLRKVDVFKGFGEDELAAIGEVCEERVYSANEVVFAENSRGGELYVVKKGRVRIDFRLKGREDAATVHRITAGQVFGELALMDKGPRSATAICECDCELLVLGRDRLYELFDKNHRIGYLLMRNLATILANRLRRTNLQLVASILWE